MAHLQLNYSSIWSWRCKSKVPSYASLTEYNWRWKESSKKLRITNLKSPFGKERRVVNVIVQQCCSTSVPSSAMEVELHTEEVEVEGGMKNVNSRGDKFGCLVSVDGWQVRRMVETDDEMRKVARAQAEAFHEPVIFFNDLFFEFFQAEVLSGLLYRLRNSPPDRYACLVAEPKTDVSGSEIQDLVGVVDVTVLRDDDVLQYLAGADEYLYVSGITVLRKFRRQKVATALLKACDALSMIWGFEYLVLRAYEDDWGARKLYSSAGYRVVSGDPAWMTTWIGRRRRVLMIKRCDKLIKQNHGGLNIP